MEKVRAETRARGVARGDMAMILPAVSDRT